MKNLSKWGQRNPIKSRMIIALSHLIIVPNACLLGIMTYLFDYEISHWALVILTNTFFVLYVLYPQKHQRMRFLTYSYLKQKTIDFSLVLTYSFIITAGVNHLSFTMDTYDNYQEVSQAANVHLIAFKTKPNTELDKRQGQEIKPSFKNLRKQLKRNIKSKLKELKQEFKKQDNKAGVVIAKIFLILLTLLLVAGLGYLVAVLACSIMCSGAEGLGWGVLFLGWGGTIWLGTIMIINILRKVGKGKKEPIEKESN